jgi:hypothetical protein
MCDLYKKQCLRLFYTSQKVQLNVECTYLVKVIDKIDRMYLKTLFMVFDVLKRQTNNEK